MTEDEIRFLRPYLRELVGQFDRTRTSMESIGRALVELTDLLYETPTEGPTQCLHPDMQKIQTMSTTSWICPDCGESGPENA